MTYDDPLDLPDDDTRCEKLLEGMGFRVAHMNDFIEELDPARQEELYEKGLSLSYRLTRWLFTKMKVKYKEWVTNPADPTEVSEVLFPLGFKIQEFFGSVELSRNHKRIGYYGDGLIWEFLMGLRDVAEQMEVEKWQFDPYGYPESYR